MLQILAFFAPDVIPLTFIYNGMVEVDYTMSTIATRISDGAKLFVFETEDAETVTDAYPPVDGKIIYLENDEWPGTKADWHINLFPFADHLSLSPLGLVNAGRMELSRINNTREAIRRSEHERSGKILDAAGQVERLSGPRVEEVQDLSADDPIDASGGEV
jgi:hypothetical protein